MSIDLLRRRDIETGGHHLAVYDGGPSGATPVLLLHGFPNSSADWEHQIPALLDAGYRVVAMDLLGLGESDKPDEVAAYAAEQDAERATAVVDALGIGSMHVVCHDRGTGPGWVLAAQRPEAVRSITSLAVGHLNAWTDAMATMEWRERCWYMLFFQFDGGVEQMAADDFALFKRWMRHHPKADRWAADLARPGAWPAGIHWYRANADPDGGSLPRLPNVSTPALVLYSHDDVYSTVEAVLESRKYLDGPARFERVDGASHFLMLDRPEVVNGLILEHLRRHGGAG